jgi:hypothetical protein
MCSFPGGIHRQATNFVLAQPCLLAIATVCKSMNYGTAGCKPKDDTVINTKNIILVRVGPLPLSLIYTKLKMFFINFIM